MKKRTKINKLRVQIKSKIALNPLFKKLLILHLLTHFIFSIVIGIPFLISTIQHSEPFYESISNSMSYTKFVEYFDFAMSYEEITSDFQRVSSIIFYATLAIILCLLTLTLSMGAKMIFLHEFSDLKKVYIDTWIANKWTYSIFFILCFLVSSETQVFHSEIYKHLEENLLTIFLLFYLETVLFHAMSNIFFLCVPFLTDVIIVKRRMDKEKYFSVDQGYL